MIKVCLSSKQSDEYLKKADEIFVKEKDAKSIIDLVEKYPNTKIVLEVEKMEIDDIIKYNIICKNELIVETSDLFYVNYLIINNIKFYLNYLAKTIYDVKAIKELGATYVLLDGTAFFNYIMVEETGLIPRLKPHIANKDKIPYSTGVYGTWIRPEDIDMYNPCILDFQDEENKRAQALYRIYMEEKHWDLQLEDIVQDLGQNVTNKYIEPGILNKRLTCQHRCQEGGTCNTCKWVLDIANRDLLKSYKEEMDKKSMEE